MANAIYAILVIIVAISAIARGFRKGITRQLASLLGFSFGAVAARVLTPEFYINFQWTSQISQAPEFRAFTANLICAVVIYSAVFAFFSLVSPILNKTLEFIEVGMLNRLAGAFFSLVKNLLWLSIVFNIFLCLSPQSRLLSYEKANDGNLISAVMSLTPAILGCYGAEDFALFHQLKEAKTISHNFKANDYVIISQG